jgi:DNA adenine methylase
MDGIGMAQIAPPLKWAGGKRWLVSRYRHLFPASFNKYIEPFVGSGAVFFALKPKRAELADKNEALVNFYKILKTNPLGLQALMRKHARSHSYQYYYKIRERKPESNDEWAAQFLYLNRTCWNGLYRENKRGEFNVPIGTKTNVLLPTDDFEAVSNLLKHATIRTSDFGPVIARAKIGDFVFLDPPYTAAHNNNGFIKYNQHIFSWKDQERLAAVVHRAVDRGVQILVTNANHDAVKNLYKRYRQEVVDRSSVIAGLAAARSRYEEVIVQCF